ncbi:MAG: alkaline phosphatase family protein [Symploca sp. SIO1B1]|nr:alkaline phosphatase family protein [Symploca sp. SIO1C2]NER99310.1 alkaline phosphatase family protein [Symploca sp. SIO1B1]
MVSNLASKAEKHMVWNIRYLHMLVARCITKKLTVISKHYTLRKIKASVYQYFLFLFTVFFVCFVIVGCNVKANIQTITDIQPTVLLISFDGFRWDYLTKADIPNLDNLIADGVKAKSLIPVFPSKTFPNHYTIVTGLYTDNHGIIANTMYDPEFDATFTLQDRKAVEDGRWWGGEPLWVTAEKQGQITASMFWPGSEAEIKGIRPTYWKRFDRNFSYDQRVDQVLSWFSLKVENRPTFITLYFEGTDTQGHINGPESPQVKAAIREVDNALGILLNGLKQRGIYENVNIIIVSDHGMTSINPKKTIFIDDYVDLSDVEIIDWSPVTGLRPSQSNNEKVYNSLVNAHPNLTIYRKKEIPEHFHYRNHRRIAPIIAVADEGWSISSHSWLTGGKAFLKGTHGYDYRLPSMHGIFIASGPDFKQGLVIESFQNIHIYNLIAHILGLKPAPNDGDFNLIQSTLNSEQSE